MNFLRRLFSRDKSAPTLSKIPAGIMAKVKSELMPAHQTEEYPSKCFECGGTKFHLISEEGKQLQRCSNCRRRYRSTLAEKVCQGKCPDCDGQLYEGPTGGAAMNISCENGHKFWFSAPFGHFQVKRIK